MCLELRHAPLLSSCRNELYLYHHRYYSSNPRIHRMRSNRSDIFGQIFITGRLVSIVNNLTPLGYIPYLLPINHNLMIIVTSTSD